MEPTLANVSLPLPFDRLFTYSIPQELAGTAVPGARVMVPFGKKYKIGYIVECPESTTLPILKPIHDVLDPIPTLTHDMLKLCRWIAEYYMAPLGEVLRGATPAGLIGESKRTVRLVKEPSTNLIEEWRKRSPRKAAIIHNLQEQREISIAQLQKLTRFENIYAPINELAEEKYVSIEDTLPRTQIKPKTETFVRLNTRDRSTEDIRAELKLLDGRAKKPTAIIDTLLALPAETALYEKELLRRAGASKRVLQTLSDRNLIIIEKHVVSREKFEVAGPPEELELTFHQQAALRMLCDAIDSGFHQTFLLHGITGSGKTQVYIEAIHHIRASGKTAIVLVPEISLTPQIVRRFRAHFNDDVVVFHSRLSEGERYDGWKRAREGNASIAIGPRSAIFAPLENIGLIIVDEEHESSYKQYDSSPRYNARDVAIMRAHFNNAVVLLGSATPSLESYNNALLNKYRLIELPERINTFPLPHVHIVNMREERKTLRAGSPGTTTSVSRLLRDHIRESIDHNKGVILLQNRRGFSPYLECHDCAHIEECTECSVTMTYHKIKKHLRCHYCGRIRKSPDTCPKCGGIRLVYQGYGTQRVEEELQELFPDVRIVRMDLDSTTRKGSHNRILTKFESGGYDILLGTQMVSKGLDFDRVTLVGVISADTQLLLPDFRSSERTFQMLTQVAGRAGRSDTEGEVIIQTNYPDHYSIRHATTHDFKSFFEEEMIKRTEIQWPPVTRLALIETRSEKEQAAASLSEKMHAKLMVSIPSEFIVLGPSPAALARVKNLYRYHLIIKASKQSDPTGKILRESIRRSFPQKLPQDVRVIIDIDPYGVL
jgi:primosomal protein N' (replication factor Y) (superfamily II helicase)